MSKTIWIRRAISRVSIIIMMMSTIITSSSVSAAIATTDYFQITAAGDATTMESGASLVFTLNAKVQAGTAKELAGADYAFVEMMSSTNWSKNINADFTAVGGGVALKASVSTPWGETSAANLDGTIELGTKNTLMAVNVDGTGTGTFTVRAMESFQVCAWAMGANMNKPDSGDFNDAGTPPGQDCRQITVTNATTGADHLMAYFGTATTAEANEQKQVTITQVNSAGGLVTSALTNVVIDTNAVNVAASTQTGLIEKTGAEDSGLDVNNVVKFTSAGNTSAYYVVSTDASNTTFQVIGGTANVIYSNSNIIEVSGMSAGQTNLTHAASAGAVVANTASTINMQSTTGLAAGDIVSIPTSAGYYSVVSVTAGTAISVVGPTACDATCLTEGANVTKITLTDGAASAFTVSNGAVGSADGYIYSVGGVAIGNQTTTVVTGKTLTNGTLSAVVVGTEEGTFTVTPYSPTVNVSAPATDSLTIGAATDMTVNGYGPQTGQTGVPVMAPVDFFLSKNPSETLTFPITNATNSTFSITTGGSAVAGQWNYNTENWGASTMYRVSFTPTSPFSSSTVYNVSVLKSFAASKGTTNLVDGGTAWTSTFTTGTGGGTFTAGGEFTGTQGGEFPPIAMPSYPMYGAWDIPTNVSCVSVDFDRPMTASDLTTSNIYVKKVVSGALSATLPAGTPTLTIIGDDNDSICLSGYTYEASSEYCIVVDNDIKDSKGNPLAGMPTAEGCGGQGTMGFGFSNMGPFKFPFHTGTGAVTVTAGFLGTNLDKYLSSGSITGVPVGFIPRVTFNGPLNPSTVTTTNVTLKKNGSVNTAGSVFYNSMDNAVEFVPDAVLSASTSYTLNLSTSVTSISGTAITAITKTFTTGAADATKPKVVYAEADNYGLSIQFDEPLNQTTAENGSYYTLKTCSASTIAADGTTCGSGSPTTVSLLSGVNIHYERSENKAWMDGLTLTPGDGFYVGVSSSVTDVAANGFHATDNKSWTGSVMDASKFGGGGQGMFNQDTMGMEDFDMKSMGKMPIGAWPMNSMANTTTIYFLDIPLTAAIPADGYIELTFPTGTDVSGVLQDQYSPMNSDFNGPSTGTPTFKAGVTSSVSTDTASSGSGTLDDGIGYIAAARKVYIQLSAATQATDFLHMDLGGVKNPSEPKDFDTTGYQVDIKTFNASGTLLESMVTMPYFISEAGTNSISGQITSGGAGVNGVRVFLDSWAAGFQEATTSTNGAGDLVAGNNIGEYKFENLPNGDYHIFIEPSNTTTGGDFKIDNVTSATTKNIALTTLNGTNCATVPVSINFSNIGNITSLGSSDSIDVFGWNTTGMGGFVKTLTRSQVTDSAATPVDMFVCNPGMINLGIGPAMPKGSFSTMPKMEWIPPANQSVNVKTTDIGGTALSTVTFTVAAPNAAIAGKVVDSAGVVLTGGKVFADFSSGGFGGDATIGVDGTFSIPASKEKTYRVGAFIPGMPPGQNKSVRIDVSGNVYVDGDPVASTGSSGANPLVLTMQFNSANSITVSGRVSDGTNAIAGAGIWAHRTDAQRPPVNGFTDESGNYILYIPEAGTWKVEANAPGLGFLGSKTLTVTTDDFTGQDFEPPSASTLTTLTVDIDKAGTNEDSGVNVMVYDTEGNFNQCITETDGTCDISVPTDASAAYTIEAWDATLGQVLKTTQTLDQATETLSPAALGTSREFTITLEETLSADTVIDIESSTGMGTDVVIPAGSLTATVTLPEGTYYMDVDLPIDETNTVITGAEYNAPNGVAVTTEQINIDGTGDNVTLTLEDLNTVTGTIEYSGVGVENTLVTFVDEGTQDTFSVTTDADGNYTAKLPDGTYSQLAEAAGYVGTPEDITITTSTADQDIALDPADKTITGTITNSSGTPVEGALVYATMSGGGTAIAETGSDGTYELNVSNGIWSVEAITDGYIESGTALTANTSSANVTGASIQLPSTTVTLADPAATTVDDDNANQFADDGLDINITVPANSVDADAVLNLDETNELLTTPSADPFSKGVEITGTTTNDSTTINSFDNNVDLEFEYTVAEMTTEGITTPAQMLDINIGYINETTDNWSTMPTTVTYFNSAGEVIPDVTVEGYATFAAAVTGSDLTTISLATTTDHLTTFAPIVSSGATPPATPSGLTATAGDGQVALSWTRNTESDMLRYDIWEANVTEGVASTLTQAACTVTPCTKTITGLANGTAYSYQIIAVDTEGNSSAGSTAASGVPAAPAASTTSAGGPTGGGGGGSSSKKTTTTETKDTTKTDEKAADSATDTSKATDSSSETATTSTPLKDIAGHWAQTYIEDLYEKGIVKGADESHYNPNKPITRAEFTKIVVEMYDIPMQDAESVESSFKDVKESEWYAAYIQAAYDKELVTGFTDKTFNPNKPITRAEAMKIILSASGAVIAEPTAESSFKDVKLKDWFAKYVDYAVENGIVNGYEDKTFKPNNPITRAEVAKIASLMLKESLVGIVMDVLNN